MRYIKLIYFFISFFVLSAWGQHTITSNRTKKPSFSFVKNEYQEVGFDACRYAEWMDKYDSMPSRYGIYSPVPLKSVRNNAPDIVDVHVRYRKNIALDSLSFRIAGKKTPLPFKRRNDSTLTVFLPKMTQNYTVYCIYQRVLETRLDVTVYKGILHKMIVVPLSPFTIKRDSLEGQLNTIFSPSGIQFNVNIQPVFKTKVFQGTSYLDNPSEENDRYTQQMQELRDDYFTVFPSADRNAYYVFVVPRFVDTNLTAYMVKMKSIAFVVENQPTEKMVLSLARQVGFGIGGLNNSWEFSGPPKGTTPNLMDNTGGTEMTFFQWEQLRKHVHSYAIYDNYENVKTNSGIIAFYFWEEKSDGTIVLEGGDLLSTIKRPFKKNSYSYHLDIDNFFYQPMFTIQGRLIAWWHIIAFAGVVFTTFLLRRRVHKIIKKHFRRSRILRFFSRILFFLVSCGSFVLLLVFINKGYDRFVVKNGKINELKGKTLAQTVKIIGRNNYYGTKEAERRIGSEILVKKGDSWVLKQRGNVLYFTLKQDSLGHWTYCTFSHSSNQLKLSTLKCNEKAYSHYCVFNYRDAKDSLIQQKVVNHLGIDLTAKLKIHDPVRRILLFVNGYRPTSLSNSFNESVEEIKNKGLEYPNSSNLIYSFDRYDYWNPWNSIDNYFQKRINPSETFYADGHFSVSTSNYESLIEFSRISAIYPKRCKNQKKHTCFYTKSTTSRFLLGNETTETIHLLPTKPNKLGFQSRERNGYIAGRNVWQLLNELPNKSKNDTLYIVSHSMGYAYSLGIIRRMRGKIHFGGYYIIAPENASVGKVYPNEWKQIWQYGSNLGEKNADEPCLQDGVAPQCSASGLSPQHRVFIPASYSLKKGFFDSHFIGYYDWILGIEKGKKGHILQH